MCSSLGAGFPILGFPLPAAVLLFIVCASIPCVFGKRKFTTRRCFKPIVSGSVTFLPQLEVVGLLNSVHECVRPALLHFLISDYPSQRLCYYSLFVLQLLAFLENWFTLHNGVPNPSRTAQRVSLNLKLWVFLTVHMSVFVPRCWISYFRIPLASAYVIIHCLYDPSQ